MYSWNYSDFRVHMNFCHMYLTPNQFRGGSNVLKVVHTDHINDRTNHNCWILSFDDTRFTAHTYIHIYTHSHTCTHTHTHTHTHTCMRVHTHTHTHTCSTTIDLLRALAAVEVLASQCCTHSGYPRKLEFGLWHSLLLWPLSGQDLESAWQRPTKVL